VSNPVLTKTFTAGGAIAARTLVKFSAAETVVAAAAAGDSLLGATTDIAAASGERVDVVLSGVAEISAGAAITRGALVMSNASGRVITAAASAGANIRTIGIALDGADADGDVIRVLLAPGSFQG
jgi:hypothetical protein